MCRECRGYKFGEMQRETGNTICKIKECANKAAKKGYCNKHYLKYKKYGDPLRDGRPIKYQPKERPCLLCGKIFKPEIEQRTRPRKYCSEECFKKAIGLHKAKLELERKCLICGRMFKKDKESKYCSRECYRIALSKISENINKIREQTCKTCGKAFRKRSNRDNPFCSEYCYNNCLQICKHCGKEFIGKHRTVYCSDECQTIDWRSRNPHKGREYAHRRKARLRMAFVSKVNPLEIFERDKWTCQICGKKVNKKLKYPHPKCATIDHIIPLSKGGTHEPKNVQLAHFVCNDRKSNIGGGQLRLF
jgi:endogenous inhibitor of DNA gyrase (YacG/DUF329 family)